MVNEPIRWNNYITNQQLEISTSANWKFRHPNWKFRVQTRNFDFGKLEISTSQLEISSSNSKFRLRQTRNFDIPTGNFEFKLEISSSNSKFRHPNWKFRVQTRNFDFGKLEISTSQLEISSSNSKFRLRNSKFRHPNWKFRVQTRNFEFKLEISSSKFRVAFQARMWHQYAFVPDSSPSEKEELPCECERLREIHYDATHINIIILFLFTSLLMAIALQQASVPPLLFHFPHHVSPHTHYTIMNI